MKRRRRAQSIPPPSSAWRWAVGGPITDFGEDGIDAGPSRLPFRIDADALPSRPPHRPEPSMAPEVSESPQAQVPRPQPPLRREARPPQPPQPPTPRARRSSPGRLLTTALAFSLTLNPLLAAAGPLPIPPPTATVEASSGVLTTPTPAPSPAQYYDPRRLASDPLYTSPDTISSPPVTTLPSTALPFYLTQSSDGFWYKVENAWLLYGRAVEGPNNTNTASPTSTPLPSYAVSSSLPNGWGSANPRLSFYKTPLIVSCSVILAVLIVIAIIFVALQRRKTSRRRKRHEARMRRKALAAAGLTEDAMQDATSEVHVQFSQRLAEFEKAHKAKRRGGRHNSSYVRTKVRVWHRGVRHRGTRNGDQAGEKDGVAYTSGHDLGRERSAGSMTTQSTNSLATTATSSPPTRRHSLDHDDTTPSHSPPTLPTEASDAHVSDVNNSDCPPDSSSSSEHQSPRTDAQSSPETAAHDPPANPTGGHLPPAYRPASVRSVQIGSSSGPSTSRAPPDENPPNVLSPEKVAAAGYYPAPATVDAEAAQAVAHRADAKAPIVVPPDEEERREQAMRHVATDDKRELERLRHGASAPPVTRVDDDGAGPSAPSFDVDESGFETLPLEAGEDGPSAPPLARPSAPPGLPAPPQRTQQRSLPGDDGVDDTLHLLPSAPPVEASDSLPSAPPLEMEGSAPSAPSLPDIEHEDEQGHHPSAPPLEIDHDEHEETQQGDGETPTGTGHVNESLGINGVRYLPVYEP